MPLLLAGALALGYASAATRSQASTGPATIRVTDRLTSYLHLGTGIGSREVIGGNLYSSAGHRIGHEAAVCTFLDVKARLCHMVFTLPRGSIVVEGQLSSRLLYELAISGGTELYDNARGSVVSTSLGLQPRRDVLIFRLTG
ncbi:MAG TPA: hypothetical protein VGU02_10120 [Gaiellaceae bacterium]|nr:hypothetical protein [Gaiellaceae bacterium]